MCFVLFIVLHLPFFVRCVFALFYLTCCGGTGTDSTVPTNTVQLPITTGTVTDSGREYTGTGFIGVIAGYIYRTGKL